MTGSVYLTATSRRRSPVLLGPLSGSCVLPGICQLHRDFQTFPYQHAHTGLSFPVQCLNKHLREVTWFIPEGYLLLPSFSFSCQGVIHCISLFRHNFWPFFFIVIVDSVTNTPLPPPLCCLCFSQRTDASPEVVWLLDAPTGHLLLVFNLLLLFNLQFPLKLLQGC